MNKLTLEIIGKNIDYFFNILVSKKIELFYIDKDSKKMIITVNLDDYNKILKIKSSYKIRILNTSGIIKIKYLINKYKYIISLFIIALIIFKILSNIVFDIKIIYPNNDIKAIIYNDLNSYGIKKYNFIKSYNDISKIKSKILNKEKDKLEWIEIDRIGCKYIINIEKRKLPKKENNIKPRDVISKKDAMITYIESSDGEIKVKKYDYVKKGDTLISGTIMNKNREVKKIAADGRVLGEVWYKVIIEMPINYEQRILTGKRKKNISLIFLNKEIVFDRKKFKNYSFKEVKLFSNNLLPIKLVIRDKKEEKVNKKIYTINNIDKDILKISKEKFKNKRIISQKVLKKTLNKSKIIVDIFYKIEEDITDFKDIENLELREDVSNE